MLILDPGTSHADKKITNVTCIHPAHRVTQYYYKIQCMQSRNKQSELSVTSFLLHVIVSFQPMRILPGDYQPSPSKANIPPGLTS